MKTKIILSLILFATMAESASAFKIIIKGGGRNARFNKVEVTPNRILCEGIGGLVCPVAWIEAVSQARVKSPLQDVVSFVNEQVAAGITKGATNFDNDLPVRWRMTDGETLEIDVDDNGNTELEPYEKTEK